MAKRRLTDIAKDLGISFETAQEKVTMGLEEDMVTGKGKNTWINEQGQDLLDMLSPMPIRYRGKVIANAPNPRYIYVYIRELPAKVAVLVPPQLKGRLLGKMVYLEATNEGDTTIYKYIKTPLYEGEA